MIHILRTALAMFLLMMSASSSAQTHVLDDFDDIADWETFSPEGVRVSIHSEPGHHGNALRIDYAFDKGGGYAIVKKPFSFDVNQNYQFAYWIKADSPPNNLEFKLVDPTGNNVWWHIRRKYDFPQAWTRNTSSRRQIEFAWGPTSDHTLRTIGSIEFAISSAVGGQGTIWLDDLSFAPLANPVPLDAPLKISCESDSIQNIQPTDIPYPLRISTKKPLEIDLLGTRELGGLALKWDPATTGLPYTIESHHQSGQWRTIASAHATSTAFAIFPFAAEDVDRIRITPAGQKNVLILNQIELMPISVAESQNSLVRFLAEHRLRAHLPEPFIGRRVFWTVSGSPAGTTEALLDENGSYEPVKGGPRIQPALILDGKLVTGSKADTRTQSLENGWMPIPSAQWTANSIRVNTTLVPLDADLGSMVRYRITNLSNQKQQFDFILAVRPFQVLPYWQDLNIIGGTSRINTISLDQNEAIVNGKSFAKTNKNPTNTNTAIYQDNEIYELLSNRQVPQPQDRQPDPVGLASGAWVYAASLEAGESWDVVVRHGQGQDIGFDAAFNDMKDQWQSLLGDFWLDLPPAEQDLEDTVRASLAYAIVNKDGPAIQPGSRTYERTWIRDGTLTSHALLTAGLHSQAVRFIDWYADSIFSNGKVPCCVDRRGADPVDENDSNGQYIHAVWLSYEHVRDMTLLERQYPSVVAAMGYIEHLRSARMSPEYADPESPLHVFYGLVPESISHEGYSAKPMHSYWDDFFTLLGIRDAARIAEALGDSKRATQWQELESDCSATLVDSIKAAMHSHSIDTIPGCAELGDYDPTSTAIAAFPVYAFDLLPQQALNQTFDRYWDHFIARRDGTIQWKDYTPYEVRIIGAMIELGHPERAHSMIEYFLNQQTPTGWRQWPEVVHHDRRGPGFIGDLPHSWVACDFVNSISSMFASSDRDRSRLLLARGITPAMLLDGGLHIRNISTPFGMVSWSAETAHGQTTIRITRCDQIPPDGIWFCIDSIPSAQASNSPAPKNMAGYSMIKIPKVPFEVRFEQQK